MHHSHRRAKRTDLEHRPHVASVQTQLRHGCRLLKSWSGQSSCEANTRTIEQIARAEHEKRRSFRPHGANHRFCALSFRKARPKSRDRTCSRCRELSKLLAGDQNRGRSGRIKLIKLQLNLLFARAKCPFQEARIRSIFHTPWTGGLKLGLISCPSRRDRQQGGCEKQAHTKSEAIDHRLFAIIVYCAGPNRKGSTVVEPFPCFRHEAKLTACRSAPAPA